MLGMIGLANRPGGYNDSIVSFLKPIVVTCGTMANARLMQDEREAHRRQSEVAQRLESLVQLAGNLAHDLNNMLTVVVSTTEAGRMIVDGDSKAAELFECIHAASTQASALSRKMLVYSGRGTKAHGPVVVNKLISESLEVRSSTIPANVNVSTDLAGVSPVISGDEVALRTVLTNLVINAVESLSPDGGLVTITTTIDEAEDGTEMAVLTVADTGHGMSEDSIARAFEPYWTTRGTGRGFGLSSVDGIVRAHCGNVRIASTPGEGTEVRVAIPTTHSEAADALAIESKPATVGRGRIMIVDDDEAVRNALSMLFSTAGYQCVGVPSGNDALNLLSSPAEPFKFVLLDISMPEKDGIQTLKELRPMQRSLPVVLITGFADRPLPEDIAADPWTGMLRKPFSLNAVEEEIGRIAAANG